MGTAGRSCMRTKKFVFTQQIEQFPWWLRHGIYVSPKYYCEEADCNWTLVIICDLRHSPQNNGNIAMGLRREEYNNKYQLIGARLIVMDSFKIWPIHASKEIHFTPLFNQDVVLRVTRSELFGNFDLNKLRFVPNDVLTVKCEITIREIVNETYASEDELEDTTKYAKDKIVKFILISFFVAAVVGSSYYIFFVSGKELDDATIYLKNDHFLQHSFDFI